MILCLVESRRRCVYNTPTTEVLMDYIALLFKAAFAIAVLWALNPLYRTLRSEYLVRRRAWLTLRILEIQEQLSAAREKRDLHVEALVEHGAERSRVVSEITPLQDSCTACIAKFEEKYLQLTNDRTVVAANLDYLGYQCSMCKIRTSS